MPIRRNQADELRDDLLAEFLVRPTEPAKQPLSPGSQQSAGGFVNNPFAQLEGKLDELSNQTAD
jgi:hypothetical protein